MAQKVCCDDLMQLFRLRDKEFIKEFVVLCYSDIHCNQVNLSKQYVRLRDLEKQLAAVQSKRERIEECLCEMSCIKHGCLPSQVLNALPHSQLLPQLECKEDVSSIEEDVIKAHANFKLNISRPPLASCPLSSQCREKPTKHPTTKIKSVFKRSTSQSENSSSLFEADANFQIPKLHRVLATYPIQLSRPCKAKRKYPNSKIKQVFKKSVSHSKYSSSPKRVYKKSASLSENSSSHFEVDANFRLHKSRPVQSACPLQFRRPYTAKLKYPNSKIKPVIKKSLKALKSSETRILVRQAVNDLVSFLNDEIAEEKNMAKAKSLPSELDGFKISIYGSEVILAKETLGNQVVEVSFNVNHSVDGDDNDDEEQQVGNRGLKSTPNFDVELKQGKKVLRFSCSYMNPTRDEAEGEEDEVFGIDEITLYEGDYTESNYAVAGDVLDGFMYDLFMNLLEDYGVTRDFIEKVSELSTSFESRCYISLLENIQTFVLHK